MKDLNLIYVTARELPPGDRPAYLTRVCEGDRVLRKRVEQRLAVADEAEVFISDQATDFAVSDLVATAHRAARFKALADSERAASACAATGIVRRQLGPKARR